MRTSRKISGIKPIALGLSVALMVAIAALFTSASVSAAPSRDFFGIIVWVGGDSIEVEVDDEIRVIPVSDDTVIRLPLKRDASLEDLFAGDSVAVSLNEDGAAEKIFVIPGKTQYRHVAGVITAASSTAITIKPLRDDSELITFHIGPETRITFSGGATELVEGAFAVVLTKRDQVTGELSPNAIEIHVTPGQPHKRPERPTSDVDPLENRAKVRGVFEGVDDDGNLIIGGARVLVDADTEIGSGIVAGQFVEVVGVLTAEGFLLAREIEAEERETTSVKRTRIQGVFEGVDDDGNWIIGGTIVVVNEHTDTDGLPYIGQTVRVIAIVQPDGTIVAREIENKGRSRANKGADKGFDSRIKGIFEGVDDDGNWIVNGVKIAVDEDTEIDGTPSVGKLVDIKAILVGGKILAREIKVKNGGGEQKQKREVKFEGVVQRLTDDGFVIRGHHIVISDLTEIEGELTQGATVKVEAIILEDGTIVAREIEVKDEKPERHARVKIEGVIEDVLTDHTFVVSGITVEIVRRTRVTGKIIEGAEVRVEGVLQGDGSVLALKVRTEVKRVHDAVKIKIDGVINEVVRERGRVVAIFVDGVKIRVQALTKVDVRLRKGLRVKVEAIETDRGMLAVEIKAENSGPGSANSARGQGYEGIVEDLTDHSFRLDDGTLFVISDDTRIKGDLADGVQVELRAVFRNGELVAVRIEVIETDVRDLDKESYEGVVERLTDDSFRLRNGRLFLITDDTDIDGDLEVGVEVEVKAVKLRRELVAVRIEVIETDVRDLDKESYEGVVERLTDHSFRLRNGRLFLITDDTDIDGDLEVGVQVELRAVFRNGELVAVRIEVIEIEVSDLDKERYEGFVEELADDRFRLRGGELFLITDDTDIDGDLEVGVEVEVMAVELRGHLVALEIEVIEVNIHDLDKERYEGIVEELADHRFRLRGGELFLITDDTDIDGDLEVGVDVKVVAVELNGELIALEIKVREHVVDVGVKVEFDAVISEIHGDELILEDGRVVIMTDDTDIDGELHEGADVEILARRFANGRIVAIEIDVN